MGLDIDALIDLVASHAFRPTCESSLEKAICTVLDQAGISYRRQPILSPKERPDLMVGTLVVELKVDGHRTEILRQLWRYAKIEEVDSILLVTTKNSHRNMPEELLGKPVRVLYLSPL